MKCVFIIQERGVGCKMRDVFPYGTEEVSSRNYGAIEEIYRYRL